MAADPIIYCLEHVTDYDQFERLCNDLMVSQGWDTIEPLGGMQDKGRDAIHVSRSNPDDVTIFAYSVREDWQKKLREDAEKIRDHGHVCRRLVFLTTASFSASKRDEAFSFVQEEFGWVLDLYGLERFRILLTTKHERIIAKHPQIFCPPFFPAAGGLPLSFSPDHLIIDHEASDEALATWLAQRLTLEGYLVWCRSVAPIAGASVHDTIEALLKQRAFRFLPVLSSAAIGNPDMAARRATALTIGTERQCDMVIPVVAAPFDVRDLDTKTHQLSPVHFDESWKTGLDELLHTLEASNCPRAEGGGRIAFRAFLPEDVMSPEPEMILSNRFPVLGVPEVIHRFIAEREVDEYTSDRLCLEWAFRQVNSTTFLSFHQPPERFRTDFEVVPKGGATWPHVPKIDGIFTGNLVPELIRKALAVFCGQRGLAFCEHRKHLYFPTEVVPGDRLYFTKPDGSRTYVNVVGKRTYWRPGYSSEYQYYLVPGFSIQRNPEGKLTVVTRIHLRFTDTRGVLLKNRTVTSRRKHLCKDWWNDDWLHRVLAIMQFLGNGGDIMVGETPEDTITIRVQPHGWMAPIGIDEAAFAHADASRHEALIRSSDDSDEEDDDFDEGVSDE